MALVRPYRFAGIPSYTRAQAALFESFGAHLAALSGGSDMARALSKLLEGSLRVPCQLGEVEHNALGGADLLRLLPSTGCFIRIGAAPGEDKILMDLDLSLASFAIERLLGGTGKSSRIHRSLTEIEQGVLSFVLLKLLGSFHEALLTGRELVLTLDGFYAKPSEVRESLGLRDSLAGYQLLGTRLALGNRLGYVRFFVPDDLVERHFGAPLAQGGATEVELQHMRRMLGSLGSLSAVGRAEVATLDLSPHDIANLELGDIVILENHQVALGSDGLTGDVSVKFGAGANGSVRCRLLADADQTRLQVMQIVVQEQPLEAEMGSRDEDQPELYEAEDDLEELDDGPLDEDSQSGPPDNLPHTDGLLRDVAAPVVVELGRLRMNTAQLARLRAGQIIRLPRGPKDPVDLVVGGKIFARGELVEVDGELGVRLIQLTGAS